jgi:glutamate dehydrogenase
MEQSWKSNLEELLIKTHGKKIAAQLYKKYHNSFSAGYLEEYNPVIAVNDISYFEKMSVQFPLTLQFYKKPGAEHSLHLRLYQWDKPIALSDILPMLENLDLRTYNETPMNISLADNQHIWISDFSLEYLRGSFDIEKTHDLFEEAFIKIYFGLMENDGLNKLILGASITWREITILRTYTKYLYQTRFRFSQSYIEKTLIDNTAIAKNLILFFLTLHNPQLSKKAQLQADKIKANILTALESVVSLDEDFIIRRLVELITATVRTNYFQTNADGKNKSYLAIKLNSRRIPDLPLPMPLYEVFVYSPRFEAIHLRNTKVARGGIRWSDRREDFRTEILGLMKAQVVKNAIIVPSGAKGGFVLKTPPTQATRETIQLEVIACYKAFICGLLDLTDNIVNNVVVQPKNVVCYDDADTYLVVAADKGTATFSDIANSIAKEFNFWLGDAFASGGMTGYDHKKLGITARGAWESIKRHFRELNVDINKEDITVIGIGDMSGDVFGNGMIYSKHIKLVAAFDHRHIFIDPHPNPEVSYNERLRLFHLPNSSWEDYNTKLISAGGGVFKRSLKSISITPQMKTVLAITDNTLTPNDLIKVILRAPVDLLFNGGIGTYVKAKHQSNADVGDRNNDYCRINGDELRCRVVGEGGNLGFTQLGRIEYALKDGLINTDFIDNSAGVDCSDHEVNLKILLDVEVSRNILSEKKRNALLASVADEVAALVLHDNYYQALVLSYSAFHAKQNIGLDTDYIKELEAQGIIDRQIEYLPDDKQLIERKAAGLGLTRPEFAVLLAYTKIHIKHELLNSPLLEDPYLSKILSTAFPKAIRGKYQRAMQHHKLHRDIIATQLSNFVVNEMGITFVYRVQMETGASVAEVIRAHSVASHVFGTRELQKLIETLDFRITLTEQYEMFYNIRQLINLATRWFLRSKHLKDKNLETLIEHFATRIKSLEDIIPGLMAGFTKTYLESLTEKFYQAGLPKETAKRIAAYRAIYTSLNIVEVATQNNFDLVKTAKVYFAAGERINLVWFRDQIASDAREGHWNALARLTLRDELDIAQRALTIAIMKHDKKEVDVIKLIDNWTASHKRALLRWERLLSLLHSSTNIEYSMFFIATRELINLVALEN